MNTTMKDRNVSQQNVVMRMIGLLLLLTITVGGG